MQPYKSHAERDQAVRAVVDLMQHDSQVRAQTYADDLLLILDILAKHHDYLDRRVVSSKGDGLTTASKAFTLAHDNLVGLMDKALEARNRG
jgi:hypothetical protein